MQSVVLIAVLGDPIASVSREFVHPGGVVVVVASLIGPEMEIQLWGTGNRSKRRTKNYYQNLRSSSELAMIVMRLFVLIVAFVGGLFFSKRPNEIREASASGSKEMASQWMNARLVIVWGWPTGKLEVEFGRSKSWKPPGRRRRRRLAGGGGGLAHRRQSRPAGRPDECG